VDDINRRAMRRCHLGSQAEVCDYKDSERCQDHQMLGLRAGKISLVRHDGLHRPAMPRKYSDWKWE